MRNTILLIFSILVSVGKAYGQTSDIPYDKYCLVFEDEFDYLYEYKKGGSIAFQLDPDFINNWYVQDTDFHWSSFNERYRKENVVMPEPGKVRLISNIMSSSDTLTLSGKSRKAWSGRIQTRKWMASYGIFEASIKIARNPNMYTSFWTDPNPGVTTEIDIFDITSFEQTKKQVIDWYYYNYGYGGTHNTTIARHLPTSPYITSTSTISDLSADYHKFTGEWTPAYVNFYIDDKLIGTIFYTQTRTYQGFHTLSIAFQILESAFQESHSAYTRCTDIDWVKIYRPKCANENLDVEDITHFTTNRIDAGMHKYISIVSNVNPATTTPVKNIAKTVTESGTFFEAESTTILPNFLADESIFIPETLTISTSDTTDTSFVAFANGFFEIRSVNCSVCHRDSLAWYKSGVDNTELITNTETNPVPNIYNYVDDSDLQSTVGETNNHISYAINDNLNVYPNPIINKINITYNCRKSGNMSIHIKDVTGRTQHNEKIIFRSGELIDHSIDISSFVSGVYFIEITLNEQHVVKKILKM